MIALQADQVVAVFLVALIVAAIFFRVRRTLGRQSYAAGGMTVRTVVLAVVGAVLVATLPTWRGIVASIAGAAMGLGLAAFGIRHTTFEKTDGGLWFTPNRWIGLGVTALFLGRLVVRLVVAYRIAEESLASGEPPLEGLKRSALTLAFYFLFAGYYVAYYALVRRHVSRAYGDVARS